MNNALETIQARYDVLLGALSEFVLLADAAGHVYPDQPSWLRYTGQRETEVAGDGWRAMVHPHDRPVLDARWSDGIMSHAAFTIEGRLLHGESGEYRYCEGRVTPVRNKAGDVVEWVVTIADVHERHVGLERQRVAAERFRRIFASNVVAICYGEHDRVLEGNAAFFEMIRGRRRDAQAGIPIDEILRAEGVRTIDDFGGEGIECEIQRRDGTIGHAIATAVSLAPERGWLAVAVDVSGRRAAEEQVRHLALHDDLTGLPNRRLLGDRLGHALQRAARRRSLVGVLFCDLDKFKAVNDEFGHETGDQVLLAVSDRLGALMREADTVARIGGDEFVVVLEDLTAPGDAALIAERVRHAIAQPVVVGGREINVGCSVGIALSSGAECEAETLLAEADEAMYADKVRGRPERVREPAVEFQPVIDLRESRAVAASVVDAKPIERAIRVAGSDL